MSLLTLTLATFATCNALSLDNVSTTNPQELAEIVPNGTLIKHPPSFQLQIHAPQCKKVVVAVRRPNEVWCLGIRGEIWNRLQVINGWEDIDSWKWQIFRPSYRWQELAVYYNSSIYGISQGGWTYKSGKSTELIHHDGFKRIAVCKTLRYGYQGQLVLGVSKGGWLYYYRAPDHEFRNLPGFYDIVELACGGTDWNRQLWFISTKGHVYHRAGFSGAWTHAHDGLEHTSNGHIALTSNMVSIAVTGKKGEYVFAVDTQGRLWEWGQWYGKTSTSLKFKGSGTPKWTLSGASYNKTGKLRQISVAGDKAEAMWVTNESNKVFFSSIQMLRGKK